MFVHSIRHGFRMILRSRTAFLVAIGALGLGIGASTAVFTVVDAIVFRPLPYADSERLAAVWDQLTTLGLTRFPAVHANYTGYLARNHVFSDMAAYDYDGFTVSAGDAPERILGMHVTANLFPMLGANPERGRLFLPEENQPGRATTAILSWALWRSRFGGRPDIVGQTIEIERKPVQVVGILPKDFRYIREETAPEIFVPLELRPDRMNSGNVRIIARLKPGVTLEQARADMRAVAHSVDEDFHPYRGPNGEDAGYRVAVIPLRDEVFGDMRLPLVVMLVSVCLVLLVACVSVSNVLLARAVRREREMATRIALGASRKQLIEQLLAEGLPVAVLSSVAGIVLSIWGVRFLEYITPASVPRPAHIGLDARVLVFAVAVGLVTSLILSLAPAVFAARTDPNTSFREQARGASGGKRSSRFSLVFVTLQVAVSVMLVLVAGLIVTSFLRLRGVSPGFNPEGLYTSRVALPGTAYPGNPQVVSFYRQLDGALSTIPGVQAAGITSRLPITGGRGGDPFSIEGRAYSTGGAVTQTANDMSVSPGYFEAAQIPLRRGRLLSGADGDNPAVVINETMAKGFWPGGDPVGHRIMMGAPRPGAVWMTIVGVVGDVKNAGLDVPPLPQIYRPYWQAPRRAMALAVRTSGDPLQIARSISERMLSLDRALPIYDVQTMTNRVNQSTGFPEFQALLIGALAGIALLLAVAGIYGSIAEDIAQRRREIGIRAALGAHPREILILFVRRGLLLTVIGSLSGLAGMLAVRKIVARLLYATASTDPIAIGSVTLLLIVVAVLTCLVSAYAAVRVDPIQTLRHD